MRESSRNELVRQVAEFVDRFTEGAAWESTSAEAAAHIVDDIAIPVFDGLPGRQLAAATVAAPVPWATDQDKMRAIAVRLFVYDHGLEPPVLWGTGSSLGIPEDELWPQYLSKAQEMVQLSAALVLEWYYQRGFLR